MDGKKIKILLATLVRPHRGGISIHLNNLACAWRSAGNTVKIYTPLGSYQDFPIRQEFSAGMMGLIKKEPLFTLLFYIIAKRILFLRVLAGLVRRRYDVINARDVGAANSCIRLARYFGVPLVVNLHGSLAADLYSKGMIPGRGALYRYFSKEEAKCYSACPNIVAVGPQERDNVYRTVHERTKSIPIIHNLVNSQQFFPDSSGSSFLLQKLGIKPESFPVLYVGRLSRRKGVDILIRAFARFAKETCRSAILLIVGTGLELAELKMIASDESISRQVVFCGLVSHSELNAYYNLSEVVVIPSIIYRRYTEGTPTVALECMAAGRPIIATPLGGLSDIISDNVNGILVRENSAEALFRAIVRVYENPALRRNLSTSARNYIMENRTREKVAAHWLQIFKAAMNNDGLGSFGDL